MTFIYVFHEKASRRYKLSVRFLDSVVLDDFAHIFQCVRKKCFRDAGMFNRNLSRCWEQFMDP